MSNPKLRVELPVKPYLKQFLINRFGNDIAITRESKIGKYLFRLLEDSRDHQGTKYTQYSGSAVITISEDILLRAGRFLTRTSIIELNVFLEEELKTEMRNFIDTSLGAVEILKQKYNINQKLKVSDLIRDYMDDNGFDEFNFPFETIKKDYYRHCKRKKYAENGKSNAFAQKVA